MLAPPLCRITSAKFTQYRKCRFRLKAERETMDQFTVTQLFERRFPFAFAQPSHLLHEIQIGRRKQPTASWPSSIICEPKNRLADTVQKNAR